MADVCSTDIQRSCSDKSDETRKGEVIECLKELLKDGKIKDKSCQEAVIGFVSEGKADIHVDPILYTACQSDLHKLCHNVLPGEGRQFQCLRDEMDDGPKNKLSALCFKKLQDRVALISYAAEVEYQGRKVISIKR